MIKRTIITPFQSFVKIESFSGILLMLTTVVALLWANSPWGDVYREIWQYKIGFSSEHFDITKPLILWINDGLMAIFFFLIGLEIKREMLIGELDSLKKLSFPIFGAIGGMTAPVLLFLLLNQNPDTTSGWGIPMATDIAFSLAILNLLGKRVPLSLKVFLTAFAIVDDVGAVLVIAIFYSGSIQLSLLGIAFGLLLFIYFLSSKGYYNKYGHLLVGIIVWILFLKSGVHPTLAGILMAFSIPVRQGINTSDFINQLIQITNKIKEAKVSERPVLSKEQIAHIDELEGWTDGYQSPLQHLEHNLHDWVAYFIIPVFAFANAGVLLNSDLDLDISLIRNIVLCLVVGNSIGIPLVVFAAQRLRLVSLPPDLTSRHIIGVAFLAGIGFTMAIFIANLAYTNPALVDSAKIGILIGSVISAIIGYIILRWNSTMLDEGEMT